MRARLWLILLLLGILFPMAWPRRFFLTYQRVFDALFGPVWIHIVMHAVLFAGLVMLLAAALRLPVSWKTAGIACGVILAAGVLQEGLQALTQDYWSVFGAAFDLGVDLAGGLV